MPSIKLTGFSGEQPRIIPRLLPDAAAQSAINTRLDDGGLTPIRVSAQIHPGDTAWRTIYRYQDKWIGWDSDTISIAPGPVALDRLYYTGDGAPKMRVGDLIYNLALARPGVPLTASLLGTPDEDEDVVTRVYCYTWVTTYGEESEPCPVSQSVDWTPGQTVNLTGFAVPPAGRAIIRQRIYRSQTGQSGTYFYLIADRAAAGTDYVDSIPVDGFAEPLPSAAWNTPPAALAGLTALPNGMMAGFVGRDLYFCEPFRPHAWPEKYVLTTDYQIVGLGAVGSAVVVLTTGQPYIILGSTPETMQMQKLEQNLPCINARSIVDLGYAIAYASNEGLVIVRADGSFSVATSNLFNRDGWLALAPSTMLGAQIAGRYVAFYRAQDQGALLIDLASTAFLIRASAAAAATWYDIESGALFYRGADEATIYQLDPPYAPRHQQYWKSKEFVLPNPTNFAVIRIDTEPISDTAEQDWQDQIDVIKAINAALLVAGSIHGDVNAVPINEVAMGGDILTKVPRRPPAFVLRVFADGVLKATVTTRNRMARLPSGFLARRWAIDVSGNMQIQQVTIAKTVDELKMVV